MRSCTNKLYIHHFSTYRYCSRTEGNLSYVQALIKTSQTHYLQIMNKLVMCPKKPLAVRKGYVKGNVPTLRRVHATIVAVGRQKVLHILSVCL